MTRVKMYHGPYLRLITFEKRVGVQNEEGPNRDNQNFQKLRKNWLDVFNTNEVLWEIKLTSGSESFFE